MLSPEAETEANDILRRLYALRNKTILSLPGGTSIYDLRQVQREIRLLEDVLDSIGSAPPGEPIGASIGDTEAFIDLDLLAAADPMVAADVHLHIIKLKALALETSMLLMDKCGYTRAQADALVSTCYLELQVGRHV